MNPRVPRAGAGPPAKVPTVPPQRAVAPHVAAALRLSTPGGRPPAPASLESPALQPSNPGGARFGSAPHVQEAIQRGQSGAVQCKRALAGGALPARAPRPVQPGVIQRAEVLDDRAEIKNYYNLRVGELGNPALPKHRKILALALEQPSKEAAKKFILDYVASVKRDIERDAEEEPENGQIAVLGRISTEPRYTREQLIEQAQSIVPYRNLTHLSIATRFTIKPGIYLDLAWREYQKASNPALANSGAILYTIRNQAQKDYWLQIQGLSTELMASWGGVYSPWIEDASLGERALRHNMAVNKVWFLGVMHGGKKITLVTLLNDETLTRGYSGHPKLRGRKEVSALGRELLAATSSPHGSQDMYYEPQEPKDLDFYVLNNMLLEIKPYTTKTQDFHRNPQARNPTIDDIAYSEKLKAKEAAQILAQRGVHVSKNPNLHEEIYKNALSHGGPSLSDLEQRLADLRQAAAARKEKYEKEKDTIIAAVNQNKQFLQQPNFAEFLAQRFSKFGWSAKGIRALLRDNFDYQF